MTRHLIRMAAVCAAALASTGCGFLGYNHRVLQRVPSPDGQLIAVCQEVPEFDGPGYDIRLEYPDGSLIRHLEKRGEARGCEQLAWSPGGTVLAVLMAQQVQVTFIDIRFALANSSNDPHHLHRAGRLHLVKLGIRPGDDGADTTAWRVGQNLRFVSDQEIAFDSCRWADRDVDYLKQHHSYRCAGPIERRTIALSLPFAPEARLERR